MSTTPVVAQRVAIVTLGMTFERQFSLCPVQDKLLQSSQEAQQALEPLSNLPDAVRKLQESQQNAAGKFIVVTVTAAVSCVNVPSIAH